MRQSIDQFLRRTATKGSWYGGGSAAALTGALTAALLEKLVVGNAAATSRSIRKRCTTLIEADAKVFARVIKAYYEQDRVAVRRTLKRAIEVPVAVYRAADQLLTLAASAQRTIPQRYQSDVQCVVALGKATRDAARALVMTNLAWLNDPQYSRQVRRALSSNSRASSRSRAASATRRS